MRIRRFCLAAVLATAPAAAVILTAVNASPSNAHQLRADNIHIDPHYNVPNINVVPNVVPDIPVPNINSVLNPGHVGLPGRGR